MKDTTELKGNRNKQKSKLKHKLLKIIANEQSICGSKNFSYRMLF